MSILIGNLDGKMAPKFTRAHSEDENQGGCALAVLLLAAIAIVGTITLMHFSQ